MYTNTTRLALGLAAASLIAVGGCSASPRVIEPIVWPPPPEQERIRLVDLYVDASDAGSGTAWYDQAWTWLTGTDGDWAPGAMRQPSALVESNGVLYVTDPVLGIVQGYDKTKQDHYVGAPAEDRPMAEPIGIAAGSDGRIYITDARAKTIYTYTADLQYIGPFQTDFVFKQPTGIWFDRQHGCFYVVDTADHQFAALQPDGRLKWKVGGRGDGDGQFNFPTFLCQRGEWIYVVDSLNHRVQIFDTDGKFITKFGQAGRALGSFSMPKGIGVDSKGHIYVSDAGFNNVQIFRLTPEKKAQLLLYVGSGGVDQGEFSMPTGLFVGGDDRIYIADSYNKRVQVLQYLGGKP